MADILTVKNLVKRYHAATSNAVDDISFSVKEGEFFAFLGPNGAGKTTTISILTTTLAKSTGDVNIAGYDLDTHTSQVRRKVGIIFQNPSLDNNVTAEENIRFHAVLYGLFPYRPFYAMMPKAYRKLVEDLAEMIGIQDSLHQPVKTLSGGMKRKLEIIRGLMHHPKILFLDEPTTGLDPNSRRALWEYLQEVRRERGTTIFLTTHYLDEAEGADRVAIIGKGKLVQLGTPTTLKQKLTSPFALVGSKDQEKLLLQLTKLKLESTVTTQGNLRVVLGKLPPYEFVQKLTVPLNHLEIHVPTLEDAYMEVVNTLHESESKEHA